MTEIAGHHKYKKDIQFYETYTAELEDFVVDLLVSYANESCLVDYLIDNAGVMPPEDYEFSVKQVSTKLIENGLDKDLIHNLMYNLLMEEGCDSVLDLLPEEAL